MGHEYQIKFEIDDRYSFSSDPSAAWRSQLEERLRAVPEFERGSSFSFRIPENVGAMPDLDVKLRDTDIYFCDYGHHALASRVLGIILMELVDKGFVVRFSSLE